MKIEQLKLFNTETKAMVALFEYEAQTKKKYPQEHNALLVLNNGGFNTRGRMSCKEISHGRPTGGLQKVKILCINTKPKMPKNQIEKRRIRMIN